MRAAVEGALRSGWIDLSEAALFRRDYESALSGTTYLEEGPRSPEPSASTEAPAPRERPVPS
jgi:hypothetical protein